MYNFQSKKEIAEFITSHLVTSNEAATMLNCTRANISDLVRRGKLTPAVELSQTLLFWHDEIEARHQTAPKAGRPKKPESE